MNRIHRAPGAGAGCLRGGPHRAGLLAVVLVSLSAAAAACGGSSPGSAPPGTAKAGPFSTQSGLVTRGGHGSEGGNESAGSFSLAFAKCMRAHGVPGFPDPNGRGGQLGPGSGINPGSPRFQAAVGGPCKSVAPPGWVSSGPVQKNSGGS
jgi:hypothetical protein